MMTVRTRMTVEMFERFAELPENLDRQFEFIGGEIVEIVTNSYASIVAAQVLIELGLHVRKHQLGYVTGEAGGYAVAGERYMPDVGFISKSKQPEPPHETWIPQPPDLAVEVFSPTDKPHETRIKLVNYLAAGTVVWVIDPEAKRVEAYVPGQPVNTMGLDGTLDDGDVLAGFSLAVKNIFPE
jgi:Uma2 family endonuclease